jgi:hypothetical protein
VRRVSVVGVPAGRTSVEKCLTDLVARPRGRAFSLIGVRASAATEDLKERDVIL